MRFLVMLSGGMDPRFHVNASDVGQGIAADVNEQLAFSHISEKPTIRRRASEHNFRVADYSNRNRRCS
jgi:hypothetical protein